MNDSAKNTQMPRFMFSEVPEKKQDKYKDMIHKLGGIIEHTNGSQYSVKCTHMLTESISFTEKILCALAAGKWVINLKYITESMTAGFWLDEWNYELQDYNGVAQYCRKYWGIFKKRLYSDKTIYIKLSKTYMCDSFRRVIDAGGGVTVTSEDQLKADLIITEEECIDDISSNIKSNIPIVNDIYIKNTLIFKADPSIYEPYLIYKPNLQKGHNLVDNHSNVGGNLSTQLRAMRSENVRAELRAELRAVRTVRNSEQMKNEQIYRTAKNNEQIDKTSELIYITSKNNEQIDKTSEQIDRTVKNSIPVHTSTADFVKIKSPNTLNNPVRISRANERGRYTGICPVQIPSTVNNPVQTPSTVNTPVQSLIIKNERGRDASISKICPSTTCKRKISSVQAPSTASKRRISSSIPVQIPSIPVQNSSISVQNSSFPVCRQKWAESGSPIFSSREEKIQIEKENSLKYIRVSKGKKDLNEGNEGLKAWNEGRDRKKEISEEGERLKEGTMGSNGGKAISKKGKRLTEGTKGSNKGKEVYTSQTECSNEGREGKKEILKEGMKGSNEGKEHLKESKERKEGKRLKENQNILTVKVRKIKPVPQNSKTVFRNSYVSQNLKTASQNSQNSKTHSQNSKTPSQNSSTPFHDLKTSSHNSKTPSQNSESRNSEKKKIKTPQNQISENQKKIKGVFMDGKVVLGIQDSSVKLQKVFKSKSLLKDFKATERESRSVKSLQKEFKSSERSSKESKSVEKESRNKENEFETMPRESRSTDRSSKEFKSTERSSKEFNSHSSSQQLFRTHSQSSFGARSSLGPRSSSCGPRSHSATPRGSQTKSETFEPFPKRTRTEYKISKSCLLNSNSKWVQEGFEYILKDLKVQLVDIKREYRLSDRTVNGLMKGNTIKCKNRPKIHDKIDGMDPKLAGMGNIGRMSNISVTPNHRSVNPNLSSPNHSVTSNLSSPNRSVTPITEIISKGDMKAGIFNFVQRSKHQDNIDNGIIRCLCGGNSGINLSDRYRNSNDSFGNSENSDRNGNYADRCDSRDNCFENENTPRNCRNISENYFESPEKTRNISQNPPNCGNHKNTPRKISDTPKRELSLSETSYYESSIDIDEEGLISQGLDSLWLCLTRFAYPPARILSEIICKFVLETRFDLIQCQALGLLNQLLLLHPPVSQMKLYYLEVLEGCTEETKYKTWRFIERLLDIFSEVREIRREGGETSMVIKAIALLQFIVTLFREDLKHCNGEVNELLLWKVFLGYTRHLSHTTTPIKQLLQFWINFHPTGLTPLTTVQIRHSITQLVSMLIEMAWKYSVPCLVPAYTIPESLSTIGTEIMVNMRHCGEGRVVHLIKELPSPWIQHVVCAIIFEEITHTNNVMVLLPTIMDYFYASIVQHNNGYRSFEDAITAKTDLSKKKRDKTINKQNCHGETPLIKACISQDVERVKKLLSVTGIDINKSDYGGWTPLHEAAIRGNNDIIKLLIDFNEDFKSGLNCQRVDAQARGGEDEQTPLHDAVQNNHLKTVILLLDYAGDVLLDDKDKDGNTAMDLANNKKMKRLLQSYRTKRIVPSQPKYSHSPVILAFSELSGLLPSHQDHINFLLTFANAYMEISGVRCVYYTWKKIKRAQRSLSSKNSVSSKNSTPARIMHCAPIVPINPLSTSITYCPSINSINTPSQLSDVLRAPINPSSLSNSNNVPTLLSKKIWVNVSQNSETHSKNSENSTNGLENSICGSQKSKTAPVISETPLKISKIYETSQNCSENSKNSEISLPNLSGPHSGIMDPHFDVTDPDYGSVDTMLANIMIDLNAYKELSETEGGNDEALRQLSYLFI